MKHVEELADQLVALDVTELKHLADYLKEKHGLEATQQVVQVAGGSSPQEDDKPKFHAMKIITPGDGKLKIVKELHAIFQTGLSQAKAMVDSGEVILKNKSEDSLKSAIETFKEVSPGFAAEIVSQDTAWAE